MPQSTEAGQRITPTPPAPGSGEELDLPRVLEQLRVSINSLIQRQEALERAIGAMGALCACRAQPRPQP